MSFIKMSDIAIVLILVGAFYLLRSWESILEITPVNAENYPACLTKKTIDSTGLDIKRERIIAIGDIHGSYDGLLEVLNRANITKSAMDCEWKRQHDSTVLVQVGDIVDRGPGAYEALHCLKHLQETANEVNSKVIRLFGNHEMWWFQGIYRKRNPQSDSKEKILSVLKTIKDDIINKKILGAYSHKINNIPILFVHAGYGPKFLSFLEKKFPSNYTVEKIVGYTNQLLVSSAKSCVEFPCPRGFRGEVFDAGPDRGGNAIGGPFWTDFSTVERSAIKQSGPENIIQVVGHTMAYCFDPYSPDVQPPFSQAECSLGLIRPASQLRAFCVDGGMYLGARAFLEIGTDGHFRAFQYFPRLKPKDFPAEWKVNPLAAEGWLVRDFSQEVCI